MGYSHYLYQTRDFTITEWSSILIETNKILVAAEAAGIEICGGDGAGQPEVNDSQIVLNGYDEESHETFVLDRFKPENPSYRKDDPEYFSFCKTARKPYDRVVVSIMVAAKAIASDALTISSDGGKEALVRTL